MRLSYISDNGLLSNLKIHFRRYYSYLLGESIVKHLLENFGYYNYEISESTIYLEIANMYLEEVNRRHLKFKFSIFSYEPTIKENKLVVNRLLNILKNKEKDNDENIKLIDLAISYYNENSSEIIRKEQSYHK